MAEQQEFRNVDPKIWQEVAGASFTFPKLHSRVYYFPIGHLQQCTETPSTQALSLLSHARPFILCTVSSIDFLADPQTDQIFAKLLLTPVVDTSVVVPVEVINEQDNGGDDVVSHAKTLTTSDANNGGAFSVPKACAESIFPPLDLTTPWPSQELSVTDVCGVVWTIRHVYRGNPKRYLFTTGWSAFVDRKNLVPGDTLVFIKNLAGNIFVGIRRIKKSGAANKITEKTVMNAIELAEKNTPFEVVCYPTVGGFDYLVGDKVVEDATNIQWNPGMRVTHKVNRCTTYHGTISHSSSHPWRMLQVEWDEANVPENLKHVSPWQVELDFSIPQLHLLFPPTKRLRVAQGFGLLSDTKRVSSISKVDFSNFSMKPLNLNQTPLNFDDILGVRQNHFPGSTSSNSLKDTSFAKSSMKGSDNVSIDLNTTDHISDNRGNLNSSETKLIGIHNSNTEKVKPAGSILLFGVIVRPAEKSFDDYAIKQADGREMRNEVEDTVKSVEKK